MSINVTVLDNGLRIASDSIKTVETVSLGAWVNVGARDEPAHLNGISHLFEHMAFKGTSRHSAREISEKIENVGGHINAYTSRENTAYFAKVLSEDTPLALDIIADIIQNSTLEQNELEREKSVICQEIRQTVDTPDDIIFDYLHEAAYPGQAMGRSVLGTEEIICSITRDTLHDYISTKYAAPQMVVAAAGRIDHEMLVELASKAFGNLPNNQSNHPPSPVRYIGGDFRQERELEQVHLLIGTEGYSYEDNYFYAASVFSVLFGGGMSSRLFQNIREEHGLVYSIYSFLASGKDHGLFGIYAGTSPEEVSDLLPLLYKEIAKTMTGRDFSEDEVSRARTQLKASLLMARESTSARAENLARQLIVYGCPISVSEIIKKIDAVTTESVQMVVDDMFSNPTTTVALGKLASVETINPFEHANT